ncbi:MAG: hypothetical protein A2087_06910 [Spirochaetes bacterium GWD1_61_31]|nr:MAG: hypothetical protein A2Y37_08560 [Spirochaetes bacterium GWB1_60_80]OHD31828.1 MAG: hypothetical protein A2004_09935 [Spirochaetes bacterium GWC1_61_12]OHD40079.1 MAG: hypothetical protein A2087_06910 [Spirochaetes bacterium GWD1_61_31]OHD45873.1 MAG: hypothetical protein A2Y35_04195 [Spirochaetes bacterium GWE1_60_18]OHD58416.1 MAG: hypothetical protein A2Y32_06585 [Spirochaetes bacterium GWF1_60_12]HAW85398.1 hypothetical protein [Spirochaetaceae bacterium]
MKIARHFFALLVLVLTLLLPACDFGFLNTPHDNSDASLRVEESAIDGGIRYQYFDGDSLKYYEDHFITDSLTNQVQRFNAAGVLQYSYLYQYDGNDHKTLTAYYDAANQLVWYQASHYSAGLVSAVAEYDAANLLQWAARYAYGLDIAQPEYNQVTMYARFDGTGNLVSGFTQTWEAAEQPLLKTEYQAAADRSRSRGLLSLTAPAAPAADTLPAMPAPADLVALGVVAYTYNLYDTNGATELCFNADWYPTSLRRVDSRIDNIPVKVELEWDGTRIARKTSHYGAIMALDVAVEYDAGGFPNLFRTSGAALLLPLDYAIVYDANRVPTRLNVSSNDALLHYFVIGYGGPGISLAVDAVRGFDPFAFTAALDSAELDIAHYDGDDVLIETFSFAKSGNVVTVTVRDAAGNATGSYQASYGADGLAVELAAYDAADTQLWVCRYGYDDAMMVAESTLPGADFGRLTENLKLTDITDFAKAFLMDLLL